MRRKLKPIVVLIFFSLITLVMGVAYLKERQLDKQVLQQASQTIPTASLPSINPAPSSSAEEDIVELKPIIDVSGWQLPSDMDYDTVSQHVSGVIVRVYGGSKITKNNNASHTTGIDKSYKTHITEFQKRGIPVAVYAYALGTSEKEMREEAREFYKAASPYKPTFYWVDIEEETMSNMDQGVKAFRDELKKLGAENVGLYIGTYFMTEQQISIDGFDAIWIPTYGGNTGYYDAAPQTDIEYHLHQYTDRGWIAGFNHDVDMNQIAPTQENKLAIFKKLFGSLPSTN
ncbi:MULTISPECIES: glycoside hydrolase family 25 protein [unclassified Streptococcus]|uniref:glycoside hydrolase family 25 protein n=1 Tax=unclassified Streptococcus TaxID=2608887 RepID=UPI00359EA7BE